MDTPLHIAFFPLMSPGHMIPMVDMARLFAARGVRSTIITTPSEAANIRITVADHRLSLYLIPFPDPSATGLPAGQQNLDAVAAAEFHSFVGALPLLRPSLAAALRDLRPDCLVSDSLFTFTADLAAELSIPRLIFHGCGAFPMFVNVRVYDYYPFHKDEFTLAGLPHEIRIHRDGLPELHDNLPMLQLMGEAEGKSFGVVVNTYKEMEPTYVDYLKAQKPTWCVGPLSLHTERATAEDQILAWLDAQKPESVVYVCFGSLCDFTGDQLREIAKGLEASEQPFIWVFRRSAAAEEEWMPEGFDERVAGRGLVVRGWAPQVAVLGHVAVGWFVTHCGWNSLLEAVCAGVPVVTWPVFHEQFINQELLVEVMGVGVRMWQGFRRNRIEDEGRVLVAAEEIAGALERVLGGGEEVEGMRLRAREFAAAARKAVDVGGSTYNDVGDLIEVLEAGRRK